MYSTLLSLIVKAHLILGAKSYRSSLRRIFKFRDFFLLKMYENF